jgi:hypothetical protein
MAETIVAIVRGGAQLPGGFNALPLEFCAFPRRTKTRSNRLAQGFHLIYGFYPTLYLFEMELPECAWWESEYPISFLSVLFLRRKIHAKNLCAFSR